MSPTLFNIFINDLITFTKELNKGILIDDTLLSILLYANDIALLVENEADLQCLIERVALLCGKNQMCLNIKKTKILHVHKSIAGDPALILDAMALKLSIAISTNILVFT